MLAILVGAALVCLIQSVSVLQTECWSYEQAGCVNLDGPACDVSTKTCYAHANVCGSVPQYLTSKYFADGWSLLISTYAFNCTRQNFINCTKPAVISLSPAYTQQPRFCIPIDTRVYANNIVLGTLGPLRPILYTPLPSPTDTYCTLLTFRGNNVTVSDVVLDTSNCVGQIPGNPITSVYVNGSGATFSDVSIVNSSVGISVVGDFYSNCGTVLFDNVQLVSSIPASILTNVLAAINDCSDGYVSSTSAIQSYLVVMTGPNVQVDLTNINAFFFSRFFGDYMNKQPSLVCPSVVSCTSSSSSSSSSSSGSVIAYRILTYAFGSILLACTLILLIRTWLEKKNRRRLMQEDLEGRKED